VFNHSWVENEGRKATVSCCYLGYRVLTLPSTNCDGGEGWEETVCMPSSVTYVTEGHFMLVK